MSRVAVLMATYNGERYLREQLDSIVRQTYRDWILYIHDDGSSDHTIQIIKEYEKRYEQVVLLDDPVGHRGAVNSFFWLLEQVEADYYMFSDQDDVWAENKIELEYQKIREQEKTHGNKPAVVYSDMSVVDASLNVISPSFIRYVKADKYVGIRKFHYIMNYIGGCVMILNSQAKAAALPADDSALMHDYWIVLNVIKNDGIIHFLDVPLSLYRQHESNTIGIHAQNMGLYGKIRSVITENRKIYKMVHRVLGISLLQYGAIKLMKVFR